MTEVNAFRAKTQKNFFNGNNLKDTEVVKGEIATKTDNLFFSNHMMYNIKTIEKIQTQFRNGKK
jgi:hypothetical protein